MDKRSSLLVENVSDEEKKVFQLRHQVAAVGSLDMSLSGKVLITLFLTQSPNI
jgi:hypothetical protein